MLLLVLLTREDLDDLRAVTHESLHLVATDDLVH
jgi:hypothetical protein